MKQHVQQIRIRLLTAIMAGAGVGFATAATAAGIGVNAHAGAGAGVAALGTPLAGGAADAHLDAYVSANSPWRNGAAGGGSRAAARMGANGDGLEQSTVAEFEAAAPAKRPAPR
jgi:hypothetical protein